MTGENADQDRVIDAAEAKDKLNALTGWEIDDAGKVISRRFTTKNYAESKGIVDAISWLAEARNHHPDVTLGWGYAGVSFTNHDAGGVTMRDFEIAEEVNAIIDRA